MNTFFNTTNLTNPDLDSAKQRAKSQQEIILDYFKANPGKKMTPPMVMSAVGMTVLTSVRRAICNLEKNGDLVKTGEKAPGVYGAGTTCGALMKVSTNKHILN